MPVQKVLKMGHPLLLQRSCEIQDVRAPEIVRLVENMQDTMEYLGGAGIAAPQIGVLKRLVIFGFASNPRYPEAPSIPKTILANLKWEKLSDEMEEGEEGCLSIPKIRGIVSRYTKIRYSGFDVIQDCELERVVSGFHARVVQHEVDHLDGVLFIHRVQDLRSLAFEDELQRPVI